MTFYEFTKWLLLELDSEHVEWFTVSGPDANGNRHAEVGLAEMNGKMVVVEIHEREA